MNWERARNPKQKAERRESLLGAARKIFAEYEYEAISLNGIAKAANFSQPNVYRYFTSREEIFLTIFYEEQELFVNGVTKRISRIRARNAVSRIADIWIEESLKLPLFLDLLPNLMLSLEKNSSVEQITEFKKTTKEQVGGLIASLSQVVPQLKPEQWGMVIQSASALMAGLWPMCNPAENVKQAQKNAGFEHGWKYETLMKQGIVSIINGHLETEKN